MRILSLLYVYFMVIDSQGIVLVPAPVNVDVLSNNFIHILRWSPGNGTQPGTVYNVNVSNNRARSISGTSFDISEYMKDIYRRHTIELWASFGNSSSSIVNTHFEPYTSTTIGPPELTLSGCGDCLNISIDLPTRQGAYDNFYKAINFDIRWSKVTDEKDDCHEPFTNYQSIHSLPYSYVLRYLQLGERYCVQVQPVIMSIPKHKLLSSCSCEFTSRIEPRGVAFLAGWVIGSVLVGLCLLSLIFSLIYTGFLCKSNVRLPKALIVYGPSYFLSPEETCISVAEVEYGIQIHKPKDHQHKKKEKGNGLYKNNDDVDEDEDEDEENHHGYMDRAVHSESESTGSRRSVSICEVAENLGGCSFEDTPTDTKETLLLSPLQYNGVKGYNQAASLDPVTKNINPSNARKGKKLRGQIKEEEEEDDDDDSGNVNLWSVVLKSMQPEEEEANEPSEAKEPLLPLLLKELHEDSLTAAKPQTGSSSELHTSLLLHTQTELQTSQEDENDISDASVCDHTRTGYMASHTGTIDTQNYSSDDEEEDYASSYMSR
nr:cytokine receptor family member b1 [Ictalurus punctatus]